MQGAPYRVIVPELPCCHHAAIDASASCSICGVLICDGCRAFVGGTQTCSECQPRVRKLSLRTFAMLPAILVSVTLCAAGLLGIARSTASVGGSTAMPAYRAKALSVLGENETGPISELGTIRVTLERRDCRTHYVQSDGTEVNRTFCFGCSAY